MLDVKKSDTTQETLNCVKSVVHAASMKLIILTPEAEVPGKITSQTPL